MVAAGVAGVQSRGKAEPGRQDHGGRAAAGGGGAARRRRLGRVPAGGACRAAADAAAEGMRATTPLVARKGRASYLGERSAGHQDPGATSSWLLLETAAATFCAEGDPAGAGEDG